MQILYGVQATGQGHISRARAMARELAHHDVEVTWLFSGRAPEKLFDMELFDNFLHRRGLSFVTRGGRIKHRATAAHNNLLQFNREVNALDLTPYDLVVTDFEPVSARAARRRGVRCIGIGHQYAFGPGTPVRGKNGMSNFVMRHFAPVDVPLGLHWHPYAANILPPILDLPAMSTTDAGHVLVYLPFEDQDAVTAVLRTFPGRRFIQYANGLADGIQGNVVRRAACVEGFKRHLASCTGVICNAGFELISECLQWRKPILTRPLSGQMEQLSNAEALEQLGYATVVPAISAAAISDWLGRRHIPPEVEFRDVARCLSGWLAAGAQAPLASLAHRLWPQPTHILANNRVGNTLSARATSDQGQGGT